MRRLWLGYALWIVCLIGAFATDGYARAIYVFYLVFLGAVLIDMRRWYRSRGKKSLR